MEKSDRIPPIIHIPETDSTNKYLRQLMQSEKLPEGSVVFTDFQTAGRGQTGNSWESETGKNLLFSVVIYPETILAREQFIISQIAALSVKQTLDKYTSDITVKWPNDIYWKEKKICGMLIENDLAGQHLYCSILGIGINLNQSVFHSLAPNPVSLTQITRQEYPIAEILNRFLQLFYQNYLLVLQGKTSEIKEAYLQSLYRGKGFYWFQDETGTFEARIHAIEPTGHLILQGKDNIKRRYAFKEVSFITKE